MNRFAAFWCLALAASCVAPGGPRAGAFLAPLPNPDATAQFSRIKSLAGNWQWAPDLAPELAGLVATYRITAGGTVVLETLFPGDPFEMVTMYHLDGNQLISTHYSTAGNQPSMRAQAGDPTQPIRFMCIGATGVSSERDDHMHRMSFLNIDHGELVTSWSFQIDGQAEGDRIFKLVPYYPPEAAPIKVEPEPVLETPTAPAKTLDFDPNEPIEVSKLDLSQPGDDIDQDLEELEKNLEDNESPANDKP